VKTIEHDGVEHSGYMSFMILVSIFPFFVFLLALTSFFGASELGQNFIEIALKNMPSHSIDSIQSHIGQISNSPPQSLLTLAVGGTLWTASSFVECLRTILNRVYGITSPPNYIFRRLLSIAQFLLISLVISAVMLMLVIIPVLFAKIPDFTVLIEKYTDFLGAIRYAFIFASLFLTSCSLYYIIPNAKIKFVEVIPGALLTVILWTISGYLLSKYIIYYNQLNIVYGSLGSVIVTLIFFYIINVIFIYGAEFNYLLSTYKK
jgi:membrane protein